ncbi:Nramp family divalent metal transporter [Variovorax saccharolyticus]|uniref:Nramp family divalent metal transporter n=1 Tax=Variovorax saccharolyticus TaxID=3053516 RepID=UPI0025769AEB|nr:MULTISPECIES: Nramp family divalent metal transporter [unclassified Variovorax]MDM0022287.1 Nramp family divalent metal transporter [Variovorax sp. J22R187]MDM0028843.1 Nramp family divalent metal transporter [Variovorax sp. J31P216]
MSSLPHTSSAPFSPTDVRGSIATLPGGRAWRHPLRFAGPGLLVAVGYMDPGNWATDIEAGARYGPTLLFVVAIASLAAMLLQTLALRLGLVARLDLARACRGHYRPATNRVLWLLAELSIVACDVAEVLGCALALQLLFGVSLPVGIAITSLDTLIVLGLRGKGFRHVEAIVLALIATIGICFLVELILVGPHWVEVARGFVPRLEALQEPRALYLAVGILGATVMPHNLYLHSSVVQTRHVNNDPESLASAVRLSTFDTVISLLLALFVNAAILTLAASAFHATGHHDVSEIQDAYHLLDPIVGTSLASVLFGIALLASGQSSTITGTIAGQVIMEGFLDLKISCWQRRLITRGLALLPALGGVLWLGDGGVGKLLVASQVVLSFQLPFAIWPLLRFTSDRSLMGHFVNGPWLKAGGWTIFTLIAMANLWLLLR